MVEVVDDPGESRYVIKVDGAWAGFMDYRRRGDVFVAVHTEIYPEYGGQGLANTLVREVLDRVREEGLRLSPLCPFVVSYLTRHPEYQDLVGGSSGSAGSAGSAGEGI